ncbi:UNVERIFIED_CONTAM: Transportin-1 [Siphonaria sp. JEL0065]|nr:Transportin-1 [Siphonaria sp. JEL0065]
MIPDRDLFNQLVDALSKTQHSDQAVQTQGQQYLLQFGQNLLYAHYLALVFATPSIASEIRRIAGLLAKTVVANQYQRLSQETISFIKEAAFQEIADGANLLLQETAVIIVTSLVAVDVHHAPDILRSLVLKVDHANASVGEAAFEAVATVCKECAQSLDQEALALVNELLPFFISKFDHPTAKLRSLAIFSTNQFAISHSPALIHHLSIYVQSLYRRTTDTDKEVMKNVCQGLVLCLELQPQALQAEMSTLIQFMLKCTESGDSTVVLEACAFWSTVAQQEYLISHVEPYLNELTRVLLKATMDVTLHANDDDEVWVHDSPLRKQLVITFGLWARDTFLDALLPLLKEHLASPDWRLREAGVFGLGAIAHGCAARIEPHLKSLVKYLILSLDDSMSLVRSVSCWTLGMFARWIVYGPEHSQPELNHADLYFLPALHRILAMLLDDSKYVQAAACKSLVVFEQVALVQLNPFLPHILPTISSAITKFQDKNLLILYNVVGTLADSVGPALNNPQYLDILLTPLMSNLKSTKDEDQRILPLLQSLSSVAIAVGSGFTDVSPVVLQRCLSIIQTALYRQVRHKEATDVDAGFVIAALDLLSNVVQGLGTGALELISQSNPPIMEVVELCLKNVSCNVRQSSFALLGYLIVSCFPAVKPRLESVTSFIRDQISRKGVRNEEPVCEKAAWAAEKLEKQRAADARVSTASDGNVRSQRSILSRRSNSSYLAQTKNGFTFGPSDSQDSRSLITSSLRPRPSDSPATTDDSESEDELERFKSSNCNSFAVFRPLSDSLGLGVLVSGASKWSSVDLLIVPLMTLLASGGSKVSVDNSPSASYIVGESQWAQSVSDSSYATNNTSHKLIARPFVSRKQSASQASLSSFFGVSKTSAFSFGQKSNQKSKPTLLGNLLNARTKYIVAEIDLYDMLLAHQSSKQRSVTFPAFALQELANHLECISLPISGLHFTNCIKTHSTFPQLRGGLVKLFKKLREGWAMKTTAPLIILMDEYAIHGWEKLRDVINGVVLSNWILNTEGTVKIRSNTQREEFDAHTAMLKQEVSLRDDFCVFGIEFNHPKMSHETYAHVLKFYEEQSFKLWAPESQTADNLESVGPNRYSSTYSDMLEIAMLPSVLRCRRITEETWSTLLLHRTEFGIKASALAWVLKELSQIPEDFGLAIRSCSGQDVDEDTLKETAYEKVECPPPKVISNMSMLLQRARSFNLTAESIDQSLELMAATDANWHARPSVYVKHIGKPLNLSRQKRLNDSVLQVLRELKSMDLLGAIRYNNDLGSNPDNFTTVFQNLLQFLDEVTSPAHISPAANWVLGLFTPSRRSQAISGLRILAKRLRNDTVSIWTAKKLAFIPKCGSDDVPYDTIWAMTEEVSNDQLLIYLSDAHPCIEEAVLHAFMKHKYDWSSGVCVLMEALVGAQKDKRADFTLPIPERIIYEVQSRCRSARLSLVRNESETLEAIVEGFTLETEREYLTELCRRISTLTEYYLLESERFTGQMLAFLGNGYAPKNSLEEKLVEYLGKQPLNSNGIKNILSICTALESLVLAADNDHLDHKYALCYFSFAFYKACRRCVFLQLTLAVTDMSTQILPEPDQVAVCLEMITTQSTLQEIFYLTSHQLSHNFQRNQREVIASAQSTFKEVSPILEHPDQFKNLDFSTGIQLGYSYIYIYPILLDLIVNKIFNSGLFFSNRMNDDTLQAAAISFLVSFPFIGGLMNSFGRTMSFYFYQQSISCMIMAVSHRIAASVLFLLCVSTLSAICIYAIGQPKWFHVLMGFFYSFLFGLFMVLYSVLVSFRDPKTPLYKSSGPLTCLISLVFLMFPPVASQLAFSDTSNSLYVWGFYTMTLLLTSLFMMSRYSVIVQSFLAWPSSITITDQAVILDSYKKVVPKPDFRLGQSTEEFEWEKLRWERAANEWWCSSLQKRDRNYIGDGAMKKRLAQWKWEKPLMDWFMLRSSINPATVQVFSLQWDALLKQAVEALSQKYQTERVNRGALLFQLESPAIIFGFLYFLISFLDKWAILFATGSIVSVFQVNYNNLTIAASFATIFTLLSFGFLELTVVSFGKRINEVKYDSISKSQEPRDLLVQYQSHVKTIYRTELLKFVARSGVIFLIVTAIVIFVEAVHTSSIMWLYFAGCFCYLGLLVGLFNKTFITSDERTLNSYMALAIVVGLSVSITMIQIMGDNNYSLLATGISSWGFCLSLVYTKRSDRLKSPYYEMPISPSLRTSGQRMIGYQTNVYSRNKRRELVAALKESSTSKRIHPQSTAGEQILGCLAAFMKRVQSLDGSNAIHVASADLVPIIEYCSSNFKAGRLVMYEVPQTLLAGGAAYSAISSVDGQFVDIFVSGSPSRPEHVYILCEAMVHEVAERLNWSHSTACAFEVLLNYLLYANVIPKRVVEQMASCSTDHAEALISRTDCNIGRLSSLGVNIDRVWKEFTHEERCYFVALAREWHSLVQETSDTQTLTTHLLEICQNAPPGLEEKLCLNKSRKLPLQSIVCHNIMLSLLAERVSTLATSAVFVGGVFDGENSTKSSVEPFFGETIVNLKLLLAVTYFAFTSDNSFARETAQLSAFTRLPLCGIFYLSERIRNFVNEFTIYNVDPFIKDFMSQTRTGISHIHYHDQTFNPQVPDRVDTLSQGERSVALVKPVEHYAPDADSSSKYYELTRYSGRKPLNWMPKDYDIPTSKAGVNFRGKSIYLLWEKLFNKEGLLDQTCTYEYPVTGDIPEYRYVFDQDTETTENTQAIRRPRETHKFWTDGPLSGMVESAELTVAHKITNDPIKVVVKFEFELPLSSCAPKRAVFQIVGSPGWEVTVEYAPFVDKNACMQPWTVQYRASQDSPSVLIKYDYSHPKHVVTTAYEVPHTLPSKGPLKEVPPPSEIIEDYYGILSLRPIKDFAESCELYVRDLQPRFTYGFHNKLPWIHLLSIEYSKKLPYGTRQKRDMLWMAWRARKISGVCARSVDEIFLKQEPALRSYWFHRGLGNAKLAYEALVRNKELLNNSLYVADRPATRTRLQIRFSDLVIMGIGGDSDKIASFDQLDGQDVAAATANGLVVDEKSKNILELVCLDSGTWPTGGGGVGSCRRDLVDSVTRARWTAIAEIASAQVEHKDYQIEKHINAIIYLPIFDNDLGHPMENISKMQLFGDLQRRSQNAVDVAVTARFVPLIIELCHAITSDESDSSVLVHYEQLMVSFYNYFKSYDWRKSWNNPAAQRAFTTTLLVKAKKLLESGHLLDHEAPTLVHISLLYSLISRFLLILCMDIPKAPVFHVSHHGTQSLLAVVAKSVHQSSIVIWDHGMLWRERLFSLCRDQMPAFTQIGFIGLTRLCARLAYMRADYVTPCTNIQNSFWAAHMAGGKYMNDFEKTALLAKCSTVLNGMNINKFAVKRSRAMKTPTAIMLSHISPVKDILNAIKAAYHIVHEFDLTSYQLHIYGSLKQDLNYTLQCTAMIKELDLDRHVILKGLGNSAQVLPTGWIFVNSSITEGLPLALGEAGLCGLPVVCTDVGGSREVISDLKSGVAFGVTVAPSRPRQLAVGQLQLFAMTDGLDVLASSGEMPPKSEKTVLLADLLDSNAPVGALEKRIMDAQTTKMREQLGLMLRKKVQDAFSVTRYCREHEQVLWLSELYSRQRRQQ